MEPGEILFYTSLGVISAWDSSRKRPRLSYRHLRGTRLTPLWRVKFRLRRFQEDAANTVVIGQFRVPVELAFRHILVAGSTGSGKTLLLRLMMQSVFPRIGQGESHRALVYDGKDELLEAVLGMRQPYQAVLTLDPFDAEGVAWNIADDVRDDASANQMARLLFPKQGNEYQPFYPESVQNLASGVMQVLNERAPGKWRLSHLLYILRSTERIRTTLSLTPKGTDLLTQFQQSGETWGNISATLSNRLNDYEVVAALWDTAPHSISMREWNKGESILVLRKHHQCSDVVDAINRAVVACAKRQLLSTPASSKRRTWIILDEAASLGKGIGKELTLLMEQGRSRNISVALGFQSMASMRDELGSEGAERLVALPAIKALLRFEHHTAAEWAAGFFGKQEVATISHSSTDGISGYPMSHSSSNTQSVTDRERWTVLPSEFQALPLADKRNGIHGFYVLPHGRSVMSYFDRVSPRWLFHPRTLAPTLERVATQRPTAAQRIAWTPADLNRLLGCEEAEESDPPPPSDPGRSSVPPSEPPQKTEEPPPVPRDVGSAEPPRRKWRVSPGACPKCGGKAALAQRPRSTRAVLQQSLKRSETAPTAETVITEHAVESPSLSIWNISRPE